MGEAVAGLGALFFLAVAAYWIVCGAFCWRISQDERL